MPESINYQSILIISVLAFATPMLISSIKQVKIPFVVGEILIGLIVGKSFLNVVPDDSWVVFLSDLGLAYLMYLSGLEIDFSQFKSEGMGKKNAKCLLLCAGMFLISLLISYAVALLLFRAGLIGNVLFFTFLLPATAPGLLVPLLKERDLSETDFGQTLLIFSLICEFLCLIAITLVSSGMSEGLSYKSFLFMVVIAASVPLYMIAKRARRRYLHSEESFSGLHMEVRASFAVILILVAISQAVGAEIAFGSFIAGVMFSLVSGRLRENLKNKIDIIGYGFLVPIFFIEIGVHINIRDMLQTPALLFMIPVLLLIFLLIKFIPSLLLSRTFGVRKAVSSSFLLAAQLSLMIVGLDIAESLGVIDQAVYSLFLFATLISCLLFPLLFDRVFTDEDLVRKRKPAADRLCIRETVLSNAELIGKPLRELDFPPHCRIFMVMRGEKEVLPTGDTVLEKGDVLLMAGMKTAESEMLNLVGEEEEDPFQ
jgi:trk system potassium uptake protein TrkA